MARISSIPFVLKLCCGLTAIVIICSTVYLRQVSKKNSLLVQSVRGSVIETAREHSSTDNVNKRLSADKTPEPNNNKKPSIDTVVATVAAAAASSAGHGNGTALAASKTTEKNGIANNNTLTKTNSSNGNGNTTPVSKKSNQTEVVALPSEAEFKEFRHDDTYKKYMQCPTTLRKRLSESKVFKDRYIQDVPVLMWNETITTEEYERLHKFWGCYGWEHVPFQGVKETLKYLNTSGHRYMFDAGLHLNRKTWNDTGCIRCAVVGGGGILKGSEKGKEIDDHDYVFRVNIAATTGYEVDVGKKTTHYSFTMTTLRNSLMAGRKFGFKSTPHDEDIHYLVLPCEKSDYILVENRGAGKSDKDFKERDPKHRGMANFGKPVKANDFKMLHPDFQRYMEFFWINSPKRYRRVNRPSTGALMLIAAIHTCDEVSAYGFGVNFRKYTTHYYDKAYTKFVYYANHDFNQELRLWNDLHDEGIINLYKREDD